MLDHVSSVLRVGVDVGGTFTDIVIVDERGRLFFYKTPSTPRDQSLGVMTGILDALHKIRRTPTEVARLIHGTTVATNSLLERAGALTALVTTKGFRDILQIGRQTRTELYNLRASRPQPLVPRQLRYEVDERTRHTGNVEARVSDEEIQRTVEQIRSAGVQSVAICFLHSYINPENEQQAARLIRKLAPDLPISVSSEILPEFREFERMSTTVLNAYVQPVMAKYIGRLTNRVREQQVHAPLMVMQSNGGVMRAGMAAERSVNTLLSGPAGGVLGSSFLAGLTGHPNCITADVGGTSFDVSTVIGGKPSIRPEGAVEGYPVRTPHIDIHTIGAGGGSMAWIDGGGALRVGPRSAGAEPGPVCYGRGGTHATVTDAHAALGHLAQRGLLAGGLRLDFAAAERAIRSEIAEPLRLSVETAADGILRVANAAMTRAIRVMTVERGLDPRHFTLIAYGGAGPLHAVELARQLGIQEALIPIAPGNFSAFGLLVAPIRYDAVRTYQARCEQVDLGHLEKTYDALEIEVFERLRDEGFFPEGSRVLRQADLRYYGQAYEIAVDVPSGSLAAQVWQDVVANYHRAHEKSYGFSKNDPVELVNVRVSGFAAFEPIALERSSASKFEEARAISHQRAYFSGRWSDTPVFERDQLMPGQRVTGPAIIEEGGATTILAQGDTAVVDPFRNILIDVSLGT